MATHTARHIVFFMILSASILSVRVIDAHKGITSKYTYNDDVFPILREKCGRCHVEGGAAPMSLMRYDPQSGAVAWAESIRENLVAEAMPPWYVDPAGPAVRGGHALSPRELDIVVTWATGGTPHGDLRKTPMPMQAHSTWTQGKPDLMLPFPSATTLGPNETEKSADFAIPTTLTETKWLKAIDVLPGTMSVVRSATVTIKDGPVVTWWEPGGDVMAAPQDTAFKLPAGSTLLVHVRYKKSYLQEQQTLHDRSTLGLYFNDEPAAKEIQSFTVNSLPGDNSGGTARGFRETFGTGGRLVALRPSVDKPYATMTVDAVASSGARTPLLKLRGIRPEWPRRYWLATPIDLSPGVAIEVSATPADPDTGPLAAPVTSPLNVALDFVAR